MLSWKLHVVAHIHNPSSQEVGIKHEKFKVILSYTRKCQVGYVRSYLKEKEKAHWKQAGEQPEVSQL